MPLFSIAVREHTYTGRFYSDVVQAGSCEEALQVAARHAAVPGPPPGAGPQHGSDVVVTGRTRTGRLDTDVVQPSRREAVQAAARRRAAAWFCAAARIQRRGQRAGARRAGL